MAEIVHSKRFEDRSGALNSRELTNEGIENRFIFARPGQFIPLREGTLDIQLDAAQGTRWGHAIAFLEAEGIVATLPDKTNFAIRMKTEWPRSKEDGEPIPVMEIVNECTRAREQDLDLSKRAQIERFVESRLSVGARALFLERSELNCVESVSDLTGVVTDFIQGYLRKPSKDLGASCIQLAEKIRESLGPIGTSIGFGTSFDWAKMLYEVLEHPSIAGRKSK